MSHLNRRLIRNCFRAVLFASLTAICSAQVVLVVSPTDMQFTHTLGGPPPASQTITVLSSGRELQFGTSLSSGCEAFRVTPSGGVTPAKLEVTANAGSFPPGIYSCTLLFDSSASRPSVRLTLQVNAGALSVSPTSLRFDYQIGGPLPPDGSIKVGSNLPNGVQVSGSQSCNWLKLSPATARTTADFTASVDPRSLAQGSYQCQISFTGTNATPATVSVTLAVSPGTVIAADPNSLTFLYQTGDSLPPPQSFRVTSAAPTSGVPILVAPLAICSGFLTLSPASAVTPASIAVAVTRAPPLGATECPVTISAGNASTTVRVSLQVSPLPTLSANPQRLDFVYQSGAPAAGSFSITSTNPSSGVAVSLTRGSGCTWVDFSPSSGSTPLSVNVVANPASIAAGPQQCVLTVSSPSGAATSITLASTAPTTLTTDPAALSFSHQIGGPAPAPQAFTLNSTNPSSGLPVNVNAGPGCSWVTLNLPAARNTPMPVGVAINPAGLQEGTHHCVLTASVASSTAPGSTATVTITINVTRPRLSAAPPRLDFNYQAGGTIPDPATFAIASENPNAGLAVSLSRGTGCSWVAFNPATGGSTPFTVTATPNPAGLPEGRHECVVTASAGGTNATVTISVNVTNPMLTIAPSRLDFNHQTGDAAPASSSFTVSSANPTSGIAVTLTRGAGCSWVGLNPPTTGTTPLTVAVTPNITGLTEGAHQCVITASNGAGATASISVSITVRRPPALSVTPNRLDFSYPSGGAAPAASSFSVASTDPQAGVPVTLSSTGAACPLLSFSPSSGNTPLTVGVNVTPAPGLVPGSHSCAVTVSGSGATAAIIINITVTPPGSLSVNPAVLRFNYELNGPAPAAQGITIASSNPSSGVPVTITPGCTWVSATPSTGNTPLSANFSVAPAGLPAGDHSCSIAISGGSSGNTSVQAILTVLPATTISATPGALAFTAHLAGGPPSPQSLTFTSANPASGVPVSLSVAACDWLRLSSTSGVTPLTTSVSAVLTGLSSGDHSCTITASSNSGAGASVVVTLRISPASTVASDVTSLNFQHRIGGAIPDAQAFTIVSTNPASGLAVNLSANGCGWLGLSVASGVTPLRVSVSANPGTLAIGRYTCAITITGIGQQQAEISAMLQIVSGTELVVTPARLNFRHQTGDVLPAAQTAAVTSTNPASGVAFTVQTENCSWLTLSPFGGTTPLTLSLGLSARDLEPGTYECAVGIRATANESTLARLNVSAVVLGRALSVTTATIPNGTTGTLYSATLAVQGGTPPFTWAVASGTVAAGLAMNAAGAITGTPSDAGAFTFTARVTDSSTPPQTATRQFTATISSGLTIVTTSVPDASVGAVYAATLRAQGGTAPYVWTAVQGVLPPGLTLDSAAGSIAGRPTSAGRFPVTVQVSDSAQPTNRSTTQALIFEIGSNLTITSGLPDGTLGIAYSAGLRAEGGTAPYSWSVDRGALPAGLSLNAASGTISGTPTSSGRFTFDIQLRDGATPSNTTTRTFTITISSGFTVVPMSLPTGTRGTPYAATLSASGATPPYTWTVASGELPEGLTLASSGAINGTPAAAGTFTFTVQVTDSSVPSRQATSSPLTITIDSALTLSPVSAPQGIAGVPYSLALSATGGQPPYTFAVTSGVLPSGLALSEATGAITGTTSAAGVFPLTVRCSDAAGAVASVNFAVTIMQQVAPTLTLTNPALPTTPASVGVGLSAPAAASLEGTLSMSFRPNAAGVPPDYRDPALAFAAGGTTLNFVIPADSNSANLPQSGLFQTGTVAGEITITLTRLVSGTTSLLPSPPPSTTVTVPSMPPVIVPDSVRFANVTPSGFNIELTGYSTMRSVSSLTVTFQPSGGSQLGDSQTFSVDVNSTMSQWYESADSRAAGSTFMMRVPFPFQGDISAIDSATVTLANALGVSQPVNGKRVR